MSDQEFSFAGRQSPNVAASIGGPLSKRWWLAGLPLSMRRSRASLFHGTNFSVPYVPVYPSVMTVHDLSPWMNAGWHADANRVRSRTPWLLGLGLATMVITVSRAVRRQTIERFRLHPDRVVAIPLAANESFHPSDEPKGGFFLFVGTLEPRKNIPMLIDAWRPVFTEYGVELWIAGRRREDGPVVPDLPGLKWLGEVNEVDLPALYRRTVAFVYPSFYEGFGLPVLEAMQSGANVITSGDPAIGEVCGDAAIRVDAQDGRGWTGAMSACAAGHVHLRERAIERSRLFSWMRTARLTREVYEEAFNRSVR
jgi:glycosyltransferase involved in cell wall biosynthesis